MSLIRLIVGLGNPGNGYALTRHNAGFMGIDRLDIQSDWKKECNALVASARVGGRNVLLAKPQTYMNLSGESVQGLMTKHRIKIQEVLVLVDDIALPLGQVRIREKGSHGGQNGLRDIIARVGADFARVRIGVGPVPAGRDVADFVLSKPMPEEWEVLNKSLDLIPALCDTLLRDGLARAMNLYNASPKPAKKNNPTSAQSSEVKS